MQTPNDYGLNFSSTISIFFVLFTTKAKQHQDCVWYVVNSCA